MAVIPYTTSYPTSSWPSALYLRRGMTRGTLIRSTIDKYAWSENGQVSGKSSGYCESYILSRTWQTTTVTQPKPRRIHHAHHHAPYRPCSTHPYHHYPIS